MFEFLVFSWALTFGYVPQQSDITENKQAIIDDNQIATMVGFEIGATLFDKLYIYSNVDTFQYIKPDSLFMSPYRVNYIFGIDANVTDRFTVGMVHECDHSINSEIDFKFNEYKTAYRYAKNETIIFAKIRSK